MKDFIVLGTIDKYYKKYAFTHFLNGRFRLGYSLRGGAADFVYKRGGGILTVSNAAWYTTFPSYIPKPMELTEEYSPEKYPKYDNYDAINCDRSRDVPKDYYGVIGVPISFIQFLNPEQFEIVGELSPVLNGKHLYRRLLIKRK